MSRTDRRTFLKNAAGVIPAAAVGARLGDSDRPEEADSAPILDAAILEAVAEIMLPTATLGRAGVEGALADFQRWVDAFQPAAELDHGYLTEQIRYGPPHPGPRWQAQLEALDLEARRRHDMSFAEVALDVRRALIERELRTEEGGGLPDPARADHVALGLLAWFFRTSLANDLCYDARIGRQTCRGIDSLPEEPGRLEADR